MSHPILKEYADVLSRPELAIRKGIRQQLLQLVKNHSHIVTPSRRRIARSTRNFLQVIDELDGMGIEFVSRRENVDTSGPMQAVSSRSGT